MSEDGPRDYNREYTRNISGPMRMRIGYDTDHGDVTRFLVQLEYHHNGEWRTVVRYDHDPESDFGHDVTEEGLHIDIYRDGGKHASEYIAPVQSPETGFSRAEDHLAQNLQRFIERYEAWHEIRGR